MYRLVLLVCLSVNLSKNSYSCYAIVSKADAKVEVFILTAKCFRKFFLNFFSRRLLQGWKGLVRSRSLSSAKVRY